MNKRKPCMQDRVFYTLNYLFLFLFLLCVLYPFVFIISCSFSSGDALMRGAVKLLPVDITIDGYKAVFGYKAIWTGYLNSLLYMAAGTVISVSVTMLAAYPLSLEHFRGRKVIMGLFLFTMMFNGGLVPSYLLVKGLHLMNTMWAVILPGALSAYNVIVARTFLMQTVPRELSEAAQIDGCTDFVFFLQIVLPLSAPIVAVLSLWTAVGLWNSYFQPMIYLNTEARFPLQLILRKILLLGEADVTKQTVDPETYAKNRYLSEILKYGTIVVSSIPLMILYPFVQKYFVKGVLIGSVKG